MISPQGGDLVCGIVGVVCHDRDCPADPELVRRMCSAISHRGPDDEGVFVEGHVGLGMRRLSIIDLAGGRQPMFNEDRSKVIVFNGEIYNYRELREGLISRGHTFRSKSDTETVLHLYEDEGPECVERLRGMFAFAIWDATADRLVLARDRFGIKPLYIASGPWGIAFASELKALVAVGLTERTLDWSALDAFFQLGYIPSPASPYRDVRKLEPAHVLTWQPGGFPRTRRYWSLPEPSPIVPPDIERSTLSWLDDSVKAHLVSDVPVAAFLSGGLDSSAVVASMALAGGHAHAFTVRYQGSGAGRSDESDLARQLAKKYDVTLSVVDVAPDLRDIFEPIVQALDEPHADESAIPMWLISRAVAREYKVALTGTGGDELFAGYSRHLGVLLGEYYHRLPAPLQWTANRLVSLLPEPRGSGLAVDRLKRFVRSPNGSIPDRLLGFVSKLPNEARAALYVGSLAETISLDATRDALRAAHGEAGSPVGLRAALSLDYRFYLPDDLLALSDRLSMAHSLEVRVPFVDHVLVERVFSLPDHLKIRRWQSKRLLRRALRTRLPTAHFRASKRGFVGPTAAWLRHELREVLEDELSSERMRQLGYFHSATVTRLLDEHFQRRQNREGILWALLCFATWHRVQHATATAPRYHLDA